MLSEADFDKFYQSGLQPVLIQLETQRKGVVGAFWKGMLWLLGVPLGIFLGAEAGTIPLVLVCGAAVVLAVIQFIAYGKQRTAYIANFKEQVIKKLIQSIDQNLSYEPKMFITIPEYTQADLFHNRLDRYTGNDLIGGKLGSTTLKFSEIWHQEKHESVDSKGRRQTTWVTIFKGVFFIADFNKNFIGRTYLFPEMGLGLIGNFFEKFSGGRGDLIKLEDPVFEKTFTVYGTDQVQARYILSTSLMERLVNFRQKANAKLHVSFIDSKMFLALSIGKDLFEPNVFSSGVKEDYLKEYLHYLQLVTGIVDDLNLNTRIWGKA